MESGREAEESPLEAVLRARLEDLVPGASVAGVAGPGVVDVVAVQWHGMNFVTLTTGILMVALLKRCWVVTMNLGSSSALLAGPVSLTGTPRPGGWLRRPYGSAMPPCSTRCWR